MRYLGRTKHAAVTLLRMVELYPAGISTNKLGAKEHNNGWK